jgi:hypothetical protein
MTRRTGTTIAALAAAAAAAGAALAVRHAERDTAPPPPFLPSAVAPLAVPELVTSPASTPLARSRLGNATRHFEYVFPDREMDVYDIDHGFRLVERVRIPETHAVRGIAVAPTTHRLYLALGGDGGDFGNGSLLAYDLLTNRVVWERSFPSGVDSPAITPDGRTLYLPTGERSSGDVWWVVQAATGRVTAEIHAGPHPHNTIVGPGGGRVYLGPRGDDNPYLYVADTHTNSIVQRVGPLRAGVRPFTLDGAQHFVFTVATGYLGFQVSDLTSGKVLYTLDLPGFSYDRATFSPTTPSHGIALSPDNRTLWVVDAPNSYVHEFDVSGLPGRKPTMIASVRLVHPMTGEEDPCGQDCARDGWLQESADGRYLFVGDSGDVLATASRKVVAFLPALRNSRYPIEVDWRRGRPVATTSRSSIGRP